MTAYDAVAYPTGPHAFTHPARLAVNPELLGFAGAPADRARVLEIGCGEAGNLIAMAAAAPGGRFVGFDLAPSAIAAGQRLVDALGLQNIRLEVGDVTTWTTDERFDYVVVHGLYAWVPGLVQEAVMRLVAQVMADDGLAVISYNVLPGCHLRYLVRDALLTLMDPGLDDEGRVAELPAALERLRVMWRGDDPFLKTLVAEVERGMARRPAEMFHDELAPTYAPQTIKQVVDHAERHALAYLCDAQAVFLKPALDPSADDERRLREADNDWLRFETLSDVEELRRFRRSLFVRAGRVPDPGRRRGAVARLYASGSFLLAGATDAGVYEYRGPDGQVLDTSDLELVALLDRLTAAYPCNLLVAGLLSGKISEAVVLKLYASGAIALETAPSGFTVTPGERPQAGALARHQAATDQEELASLRHQPVRIASPFDRRFLALLDGTHDREALAVAMAEAVHIGIEEARESVPRSLEIVARQGLLQA